MIAWRITRARFADTAFTGDGAAEFPGRWNGFDEPMVYCADSLALAALEVLVNVGQAELPDDLVYITAAIPDDAVTSLDRSVLPADWRRFPRPDVLQALGSTWLRSGTSLALLVPSVVIPPANVVLINPRHSRFAEVRISPQLPFELDPRLR